MGGVRTGEWSVDADPALRVRFDKSLWADAKKRALAAVRGVGEKRQFSAVTGLR